MKATAGAYTDGVQVTDERGGPARSSHHFGLGHGEWWVSNPWRGVDHFAECPGTALLRAGCRALTVMIVALETCPTRRLQGYCITIPLSV
jgi:hypothetical protein